MRVADLMRVTVARGRSTSGELCVVAVDLEVVVLGRCSSTVGGLSFAVGLVLLSNIFVQLNVLLRAELLLATSSCLLVLLSAFFLYCESDLHGVGSSRFLSGCLETTILAALAPCFCWYPARQSHRSFVLLEPLSPTLL